jgi:hypothetical protein
MSHDFAAENQRRQDTRVARMYLANFLVHGSVHELNKAIILLQEVAAKTEKENS